MKRVGLLLALVFFGSSANAAIVDIITGADMGGIEVTAFFDGGSSETVVWVTTGTDASIPGGEGFSGEAAGTGWTLAQQGFTLGNLETGSVLGAWTLSNDSALDIERVVIDALAGNIVFDAIGLQTRDTNEYTPGSNVGRGFQSERGVAFDALVASYGDVYSPPDLFGSLTIDFTAANTVLGAGDSLRYVSDTDKIPVPAPLALLLIGGLGLLFKNKVRA